MAFSMADLESRQFRSVKHGYDPDEVDSFLRLVAVDVRGDMVEADSIRQHAAKQIEELEERVREARAETAAARATTERVLEALRLAEAARDDEAARAERIEQERAAVEAALLGADKLCPQCEQAGQDVATILGQASETAGSTVAHAEAEAAEIRRQAEEYSSVIRAEVDAYAAVTRCAADEYATKVRTTSHYEGQANLAEIQTQAHAIIDQAEAEAKAIRDEAERYAANMIADLDALQKQTEQEARSLVDRARHDAGAGIELDLREEPAEHPGSSGRLESAEGDSLTGSW